MLITAPIHLSVTSDFMLLLRYSESSNMDSCIPHSTLSMFCKRLCFMMVYISKGCTIYRCSGTKIVRCSMIIRCGVALRLSTVTNSGCREDVCFAIGKPPVAASYHDDIIIDHLRQIYTPPNLSFQFSGAIAKYLYRQYFWLYGI